MQSMDFKNKICNNLNQMLFYDELSLNNQLIDSLIRVRKEKDISQRELANLCGLQQSNISRMENKKYCPSIDELNKIFNKLGYRININVERIIL